MRTIVLGYGLVCISQAASTTGSCMSDQPDKDGEEMASLLQVHQQDKRCSGHGEDCRQTKCCKVAGYKCFKKSDHWATCNATCDSAAKWNRDLQRWEHGRSHTWECTELTPEPTGCSAHGEDCRKTKCCQTPGSQCFEKNAQWASCNQTCHNKKWWNANANEWHHAPSHVWDCTVLSGAPSPVPKPSYCSGLGEDCRDTKCCQTPGSQCFEKNAQWASCNQTCHNKKWWNANANEWHHAPSHVWDCTVLSP